MRVASWNVNGIRARTPNLIRWLTERQPTVVGLQELRTSAPSPLGMFESVGYYVASVGHVGLCSVEPLSDVSFPTDDGRSIAATIAGLRVLNVYAPNGRKAGSPTHREKIAWLREFGKLLATESRAHERLVVLGDFNVALEPIDVWEPRNYRGRNLFTVEERDAMLDLIADATLHDVVREQHRGSGLYTWWNVAHDSFQRGRGWRLDYILCSAPVAKAVRHAVVDVDERSRESTSDHAPLWVDLHPMQNDQTAPGERRCLGPQRRHR